ncbi:MAG: PTS sugar transporter subunit IIA [Deltaproteobacteria bacterium]|nr:PTS sugar transporter subunit IIA [Deltaproteobacteria bacterium]
MHLTVRDAAKLLQTREQQVYRWIDDGELSCEWIGEQPRFNRAELLEWATARRMPVAVEEFQDEDEDGAPLSLVEALTAGGVHAHVPGDDRESVLRAVEGVMRLPEELDQETLIQVLLAREAGGSTAVGNGIAIPHVRQPIAVSGGRASVALCYLENPVEFGALDGKPVHTLFSIVSPTIRGHLQLLARLATALHDAAFKEAVLRRAGNDEILKEAARVEARVPQAKP